MVLRGEGKSGGEVAGRKERWSEMVGTGGEGERWMVPLLVTCFICVCVCVLLCPLVLILHIHVHDYVGS